MPTAYGPGSASGNPSGAGVVVGGGGAILSGVATGVVGAPGVAAAPGEATGADPQATSRSASATTATGQPGSLSAPLRPDVTSCCPTDACCPWAADATSSATPASVMTLDV